MLAAADLRVIGWHQSAVDRLQRQPAWIARQCLALAGVLYVVRFSVFGVTDALIAALLALGLLGLASLTFVPAAFASIGRLFFLRAFVLITTFLRLLLLAVAWFVPSVSEATQGVITLGAISDLCVLAFHYLAACRPPRPRKPAPRTRLATSSSPA